MTVQLLLEDGHEIERAIFARGSRENRKSSIPSKNSCPRWKPTFELIRAISNIYIKLMKRLFPTGRQPSGTDPAIRDVDCFARLEKFLYG
jgi:hypothetical protein